MRRTAKKQLELFEAGFGSNMPPRLGHEGDRLYRAILFLRIYGAVPVFRVGKEHLVGGRQVSTHQLHQLRIAACKRVCGSEEIPGYALGRLGFAPPPKPAVPPA